MKTIIASLFSGLVIFAIGFVTYPKNERVYKCTDWKPTDHVTIPVNNAKNELSKFKQSFEIEKEKIQEALIQAEFERENYLE